MVVEAPVASAAELSPVGELLSDVGRGLAVLRVLEGEPLLVDMLVLVNPPVVVIEVEVVALGETAVLVEAVLVLAVLVSAVLVSAVLVELGEDDTDLTVLSDSTTNWAE